MNLTLVVIAVVFYLVLSQLIKYILDNMGFNMGLMVNIGIFVLISFLFGATWMNIVFSIIFSLLKTTAEYYASTRYKKNSQYIVFSIVLLVIFILLFYYLLKFLLPALGIRSKYLEDYRLLLENIYNRLMS